MKQNKSNASDQIFYLGKWVDRKYFRVFVYRKDEEKLANSAEEFESLIKSGIWFDSKESIPKENRKIRKSADANAEPDC